MASLLLAFVNQQMKLFFFFGRIYEIMVHEAYG
jgi:hypothetical protein